MYYSLNMSTETPQAGRNVPEKNIIEAMNAN